MGRTAAKNVYQVRSLTNCAEARTRTQDSLRWSSGAWRRVRHDGNPIGYARVVMFRTYVSRWRAKRRQPTLHEYQEPPSLANAAT